MGDSRTISFKLTGESAELFQVETCTTVGGSLETAIQLEFPSVYVKGMDLSSVKGEHTVEPWVRIAFNDGRYSVRFQLDVADAQTLGRILLSLFTAADEVHVDHAEAEPAFMLATS
jgi:hypothetical protein